MPEIKSFYFVRIITLITVHVFFYVYESIIEYMKCQSFSRKVYELVGCTNYNGNLTSFWYRWFGKCWYVHNLLKYEFDVEFDVSTPLYHTTSQYNHTLNCYQ